MELCLVIAFVTKHLIHGFDDNILKNQLIDGSCVAFKPGRLQPADAAPDNGLDTTVVPVETSEHFTTFSADDDLGEAVVATIASFLAVGTGFYHSSVHQFFLYLQVNVLRNNGFVVAFYIVLWNKTVIFNSGLVQKVCSVGLLEQCITDVFLISENFVDGDKDFTLGIHCVDGHLFKQNRYVHVFEPNAVGAEDEQYPQRRMEIVSRDLIYA